MTCFWTDFVNSYDPTCSVAPAHLYTKPAIMRIGVGDEFGGGYDYAATGNAPNFNDALFSDFGVSVAATATTATITHLAAYETDFASCNTGCWSSCVNQDDTYLGSGCYPTGCTFGSDPEAPPTLGLLANYTVSIGFAPTGLFPFASALAATPVIDGVSYHNSNTIVIATVVTDVGTALYIFGGETCY